MVSPRAFKLHKGRTWAVMLLPWAGFRDMHAGFATAEAARAWAVARGHVEANQ